MFFVPLIAVLGHVCVCACVCVCVCVCVPTHTHVWFVLEIVPPRWDCYLRVHILVLQCIPS